MPFFGSVLPAPLGFTKPVCKLPDIKEKKRNIEQDVLTDGKKEDPYKRKAGMCSHLGSGYKKM